MLLPVALAGLILHGPMQATDELLIALTARVLKLEATLAAMANLSLQHMSLDDPNPASFQSLAELFADTRAAHVHNQIKSFAVQFPDFGKILQEHVLVSESDLQGYLDNQE